MHWSWTIPVEREKTSTLIHRLLIALICEVNGLNFHADELQTSAIASGADSLPTKALSSTSSVHKHGMSVGQIVTTNQVLYFKNFLLRT